MKDLAMSSRIVSSRAGVRILPIRSTSFCGDTDSQKEMTKNRTKKPVMIMSLPPLCKKGRTAIS